MNIHKVTIAGRLGQDPELKAFDSGATLCRLSIATNRSKKKEDGSYEDKTTWHRVSVWGKRGQWISENLKTGDAVFVEGENEYYEWKDESGNKRSGVQINASFIEALTPVKKSEIPTISADELPF